MARVKGKTQQIRETEAAGNFQIVTADDLEMTAAQCREMPPVVFATYVKALRQNARQGTVGCKTRSELAFSNKKPWKQKGTGRARVGSIRSPLWRKGGILFGPQPRVRTLKVSQDSRRGVLNMLLWNGLEKKKIIALDFQITGDKPKTVAAYTALQQAGLIKKTGTKKIIFFVAPHDYQVQASFSNIPHVDISLFDQPHAIALSRSDYWVFLKKDSEMFKQMVGLWI